MADSKLALFATASCLLLHTLAVMPDSTCDRKCQSREQAKNHSWACFAIAEPSEHMGLDPRPNSGQLPAMRSVHPSAVHVTEGHIIHSHVVH